MKTVFTGAPSVRIRPSCSTVIRSASSKIASITITVRPRLIAFRSCTVSPRSRGLKPASGSSSSKRLGELASASGRIYIEKINGPMLL